MASSDTWFPKDYSPCISTERWLELLANRDIVSDEGLIVLKCMKDFGGEATCKQLSLKYGRHSQFYNLASSRLAKRIAQKTGCPVLERDNANSKWWPILFLGRYADAATEGTYVWKLRAELSKALELYDISSIPLYENKNKENISDDSCNETKKLNFKILFPSLFEKNRIIFGAPGTGKSYKLKRDAKELFGDNFERVTFHPDYTYSHFVGCYKPQMTPQGMVRYGFVPGPFLRVLVKALRSGMQGTPVPSLLLIEEINRARVSAVFGDTFQLLDRVDNEYSEYAITVSEDIKEFLRKELDCSPGECSRIRIPGNMFIWATMNSADQGVFPLDTAFKRRWTFEYLPVDDPDAPTALIPVHIDGKIVDVSWNSIRIAINDKLSSMRINEDKLIGPYFLKYSVLACDEHGRIKDFESFNTVFKNKILMYLFEDAARQRMQDLFAGCANCHRYSTLCRDFDKKGFYIFGADFIRSISKNHI